MKKRSAHETLWVEDAVHLYLAREQAEALKSYLDRGHKLRQLSDQALAEKHLSRLGQNTCTRAQTWGMSTPNTNCAD